jgi:hypothetical protein
MKLQTLEQHLDVEVILCVCMLVSISEKQIQTVSCQNGTIKLTHTSSILSLS